MSRYMIGRSSGFSLVEFMIASFIGSIMVAIVLHQYISTQRQYQHFQGKFVQAIDAQYAVELMRSSIRSAGYTPCMNINHLHSHPRLAAITAKVSSLQVQRMTEAVVVKNILSPQQLLVNKVNLHLRDKVLIADCYHAEINHVKSVTKTSSGMAVTIESPLFFQYQAPIYVGRWVDETFFTKPGKRGLFYQDQHVDQLTPLVTGFIATLNKLHGYTTVSSVMQFEGEQQVKFSTRVRMK